MQKFIFYVLLILILFLSTSSAKFLPLFDNSSTNFTTSLCLTSKDIEDRNGHCWCESGYVRVNGSVCVNADQFCKSIYSGTIFNVETNTCTCPGRNAGPNFNTGRCPISCKDLYGEFGVDHNGTCGCSLYHKLEGGSCVMDYDAYFNKDKDMSPWGRIKYFFKNLGMIIVFLIFAGLIGFFAPKGNGRPYR